MRAARIAVLVTSAAFFSAWALAKDYSQVSTVYIYPPHKFSLPEYVAELNELSSFADDGLHDKTAAQTALNDLRGGWEVQADGQSFSINIDWLFGQFEKLEKNPTPQVRDEIVERLKALKDDAQKFQQPPADTTAAHSRLTQILARREFHRVQGESWWDRLKFRIQMWIYRLLSRFFGSSSAPTVGRFFVWTLVGLAVLALAYFVFRTIRENARLETIMPEVLPVSAKQWRIWMKEARAAAAKGQWRDAVHLAYWAGISFLEENGMWRPDQARTPREYLRLIPTNSQHRDALSTMTRRLEVTWYGNEPAGPETFQEAVSNLESLGCRD